MHVYLCLCSQTDTFYIETNDAMRASFSDRLVVGLQKLHRNGKAKRQTTFIIVLITNSRIYSIGFSMGINNFRQTIRKFFYSSLNFVVVQYNFLIIAKSRIRQIICHYFTIYHKMCECIELTEYIDSVLAVRNKKTSNVCWVESQTYQAL